MIPRHALPLLKTFFIVMNLKPKLKWLFKLKFSQLNCLPGFGDLFGSLSVFFSPHPKGHKGPHLSLEDVSTAGMVSDDDVETAAATMKTAALMSFD